MLPHFRCLTLKRLSKFYICGSVVASSGQWHIHTCTIFHILWRACLHTNILGFTWRRRRKQWQSKYKPYCWSSWWWLPLFWVAHLQMAGGAKTALLTRWRAAVHPACQSYTAWLGACGVAVQGPIAPTNATATMAIPHSLTARDACQSASAAVSTSRYFL